MSPDVPRTTVPGRDPSVWDWATGNARASLAWQEAPRCSVRGGEWWDYEDDLWATCEDGETADPSPWMALKRDEFGCWMLSHWVGIWWGETTEPAIQRVG